MARPDLAVATRWRGVRRAMFWVGTGVGVVLLLLAGFFVWLGYQFHRGQALLDDVCLSPANCQTVGPDLVKLCQSNPHFFQNADDAFDPAWAPPSIGKLHPEAIDILPEHASVTFGGGFYHCGWDLTPQPGFIAGSPIRSWTLSFTSEGSAPKVLQTFTAPVTAQFSDRELDAQAVKEMEARSGTDVINNAVGERIKFMFRQGLDEDARAGVRRCAAQYPSDWCDQLLRYLLDGQSNPQAATSALMQWAGNQSGFDRWILAAYAFGQAGDLPQMRAAVGRALSKPIVDDKDAPGNARYLGLSICVKLGETRDFSDCIKLCDAIAAYNNGPGADATYLQPNIARVRAVAMSGSPAGQFSETDLFDPFEGVDLPRLMGNQMTAPSTAPGTP